MSVSSVKPTSLFQGLEKAAVDSGFFKGDPAMLAVFSSRQSSKTAPVAAAVSRTPSEVFWALGDDWWKQLYDGKYHRYGKEVFDKGLHGRDVEPGFYADALKACQWISEQRQLTACPTVEMYINLNKIACQHFDGKSTLVASDQVGKILAIKDKHCDVDYLDFFTTSPEVDKVRKEHDKYSKYIYYAGEIEMICSMPGESIGWLVTFFPGQSKKELLENLEIARAWNRSFNSQAKEKRDAINSYLEQRSKDLGLSHPLATLSPMGNQIVYVSYECSTEELEKATRALFAEYNKNMAKATSKEEKLRLIADLFQMLEWLHPFPDGQGRTDLMLLSKELCRHGFTPAILDQPYVSTFSTLDDWVEYLKKGMEKWQQEAAKKGFPGTKV